MYIIKLFTLVVIAGAVTSGGSHINSRIVELNARFVEKYHQSYYLVMFYAPWCAFCKRLDPVWSHVQQDLHHTGIQVARLNCVQYPFACRHFEINNFPTIMFIKKDQARYEFDGDRTRNEIVHFTLRVASDPVKHLKDTADKRIKDDELIFFVYIGDTSGELWTAYNDVASRFHVHCYFFYAPPHVAEKYYNEISGPTIFVNKEKEYHHFTFDHSERDINESLTQWVNEERFPLFVKINAYNFNIITQCKKYLVIAIVEESKTEKISEEMMEFRNMVESVIRDNKDRFHRNFQFGWIGSPELARNIALQNIPIPFLIVYNTSTHHHYMPDENPANFTPEAIANFLDSIQNKSAIAYGGTGYGTRVYRAYFEFTGSLSSMWYGNPLLTSVVLGVPFGFFIMILYSLFCYNLFAVPDDEDSDELSSCSDGDDDNNDTHIHHDNADGVRRRHASDHQKRE